MSSFHVRYDSTGIFYNSSIYKQKKRCTRRVPPRQLWCHSRSIEALLIFHNDAIVAVNCIRYIRVLLFIAFVSISETIITYIK